MMSIKNYIEIDLSDGFFYWSMIRTKLIMFYVEDED